MGDKSLDAAKINYDAVVADKSSLSSSQSAYTDSDPKAVGDMIVKTKERLETMITGLMDQIQSAIDSGAYTEDSNTALTTHKADWATAKDNLPDFPTE